VASDPERPAFTWPDQAEVLIAVDRDMKPIRRKARKLGGGTAEAVLDAEDRARICAGLAAQAWAPSPEELARFELNDFGNAMRLIRLVGGEVDEAGEIDLEAATLLYLREIGWIGWNGRHWDLKLGQRLAERTAHKVAQGLVAQRPFWAGDRQGPSTSSAAGNAGAISAMLRVAESYLQVELDDFDADPLAVTVRTARCGSAASPATG
jgi:hypothetical protein